MCFRIGEKAVMAADRRCLGKPGFQDFSLSFTVPSDAEAERLFATLAAGGQVQMPLTKTFFSPRFGSVADAGLCRPERRQRRAEISCRAVRG